MNQKVMSSIGFSVLVISCLLALGSSIAILYLHVNTLTSLQELQEQHVNTSTSLQELQEQQDILLEKLAEKIGDIDP